MGVFIRKPSVRRAFTLIELLVSIVIIALLIGILIPALGSARDSARAIVCQTHLRTRVTALSLYANDFDESIASFTWKPGVTYNQAYGPASTRQEAAAHQAMTLIGDLLNQELDAPPPGVFPFPAGYYALLRPYVDAPFHDETNACPSDVVQQRWLEAFRNDPTGKEYLDLMERPFAGLRLDVVLATGLNSMYFMVESAFSADRGPTVSNGPTHLSWNVPEDAPLGGRRLHQVSYPSSKVWLYEYQDQHHAPSPQYFAYPSSKCNLAMFDASISARLTEDADAGWNPAAPMSDAPTEFQYAPDTNWESPPAFGSAGDVLLGWYRYTRNGLRGIDFSSGN